MYLALATDHIRVRKNIRLLDGREMASRKTIWKLLWRGFSVDDVCNIIKEQYMFWDNKQYWEEKKNGVLGKYYWKQYSYGNRGDRYTK